jgi:hypothetical protein
MNSAPRGGAGSGRTRKENAGQMPAFVSGREQALRGAESGDCGAGTTPQDPGVSLGFRRWSLTMKRLLWLSEFNAVIDVRCGNQRIEQLNMSPLFTLNQNQPQEFLRF